MARLELAGDRSDAIDARDEVRIEARLREAERSSVGGRQRAGQVECRQLRRFIQQLKRLQGCPVSRSPPVRSSSSHLERLSGNRPGSRSRRSRPRVPVGCLGEELAPELGVVGVTAAPDARHRPRVLLRRRASACRGGRPRGGRRRRAARSARQGRRRSARRGAPAR